MSEIDRGEQLPIDAWYEVGRIPGGRVVPDSKDTLMLFIEEPMRAAIGTLYDKNVPTVGCSCNANDYFEGRAWITLDWDLLSADNRQVVEEYPHYELTIFEDIGRTFAGIFFPIEHNDLPVAVGTKALELAEKFRQQ
jgi:hypothetical protein